MNFYELFFDIHFKNRWYLGDIVNDDLNWKFTNGEKTELPKHLLQVKINVDGLELDFELAGYASVPIVSERFKNKINDIPHLTFIPIEILNKKVSTSFYIMLIEKLVDCVDEKKSEFQKFTEDDPIRPDLAGNYHSFINFVVDPQKINDVNIFRVKNSTNTIVVSEEIKEKIQHLSGLKLTLCS